MKKIRWGIISTSGFGVGTSVPAMQKCRYAEVVAISSRNLEKAKKVANELKIPKFYGSYEEMLADPEIEAVYNPLPNHLHVPLSVKALEAGKHVLCEKPIAMTGEDGIKLLKTAGKYPHLKVMEAFMYKFHTQWKKVKELVMSGRIGDIQTIETHFSYKMTDNENVRNFPEMGGGGLLDVGCYCISVARFLYGKEPKRIIGITDHNPEFNVDWLTSGILDFGQGTSTFTCGTNINHYQRVNIFGTDGRIEIEMPFNPPPDKKSRIWLDISFNIEEIAFDPFDQYTEQGDQFSRAIMDNTEVPFPLEDAIGNMRAIDAAFRSAKNRKWEKIAN